MTGQEFKAGWAMLTAALGFEVAQSQEAFYAAQLRGLEAGAFMRGVQELVTDEGFAEFTRFRRVPTVHEIRSACQYATRADRCRPDPEAREIVERYYARQRKRLPGPSNTGHRDLARPLPAIPAPRLTPAEWEDRRRELVAQADELLGGDDGGMR